MQRCISQRPCREILPLLVRMPGVGAPVCGLGAVVVDSALGRRPGRGVEGEGGWGPKIVNDPDLLLHALNEAVHLRGKDELCREMEEEGEGRRTGGSGGTTF